MAEMKDVLNLLGELKDDSEQSKKFRAFIDQEKWSSDQIRKWLDECVGSHSGAHDPHNRAFQDLIVSVGSRFGFKAEYGRYAGKAGEENFDGIWRRGDKDAIILEVKMSAWPGVDVDQLGGYIEELSKKETGTNILGLYVIGQGDVGALIKQILGSKFRDRMRLIRHENLMDLLSFKEELESATDEKDAIEKVQKILLPIESIDLGNIVNLMVEIAQTKSMAAVPEIETPEEEEENKPWSKNELISYLGDARPFQRLLLAALVQVEKEPSPGKTVIHLMSEIAKKKTSEGIDKTITMFDIAGARAGLKMRRKPLKKEDIIDAQWSSPEKDHVYKIKKDYKEMVAKWVKDEGLWVRE